MTVNHTALAASLVSLGIDMTEASTGGGGDYTPPAEGPVHLRFFSYIELGSHKTTFKGVEKVKPLVQLGFELSGPNHPASEDGVPYRIYRTLPKSLHEKAELFRTFKKMNHAGKAKHIVELIGTAFLGSAHHRKYVRKDGKPGVSAELNAPGEPIDIRPTSFKHPASGAVEEIAVAPLLSPIRVFVWDLADRAQWDSIFIDGEYPAFVGADGAVVRPARSKNKEQEKIKSALNFPGSPIEHILACGNGPDPFTAAAHVPAAGGVGDDDLLAGIA